MYIMSCHVSLKGLDRSKPSTCMQFGSQPEDTVAVARALHSATVTLVAERRAHQSEKVQYTTDSWMCVCFGGIAAALMTHS